MKKIIYQKNYSVDIPIQENANPVLRISSKLFFKKLKEKLVADEQNLVPLEEKIRDSKKFITCAKKVSNDLAVDIKIQQISRGIIVTFSCDALFLLEYTKGTFIELLNLTDEVSFLPNASSNRLIITLEYWTHTVDIKG